MKRVLWALLCAAAGAGAFAFGRGAEPMYTVSFADATTATASLMTRYGAEGDLDAATVTIPRPDGKRRDQSRITGEELARAPGVLTPVRLFVTETWEGGKEPPGVGEKRAMVLTGFGASVGESVQIERLPDVAEGAWRAWRIVGEKTRWRLLTDGRRLGALEGEHGVRIVRVGEDRLVGRLSQPPFTPADGPRL